MGGKKVTGNPKNSLNQHMYREAIACEMDRKGTLEYTAFPLVNWEAMDLALQARSPSFCAWVTKHVSGQCAVGRKMKLWGFWTEDTCPCCGQPDETTTHFPFCTNPQIQEAYGKQVDSFISWMAEADTDPNISYYFTKVLRDKTLDIEDLPFSVDQAAQEQARIGWNNLLFGRLTTSWMALQEEHYRSTRSRRSPERWAADITYKLLQLSHGLWMARNGYLHEKDSQGLHLKVGQDLREAITEQFNKGKSVLLAGDYHLIEDRPLVVLLELPPSDKYIWLAAITLAHKEARKTRRSEVGRMRTDLAYFMVTGFCRPVAAGSTTQGNNTANTEDTNDNNKPNSTNDDNTDDNNDNNNDINDDDDEAPPAADS